MIWEKVKEWFYVTTVKGHKNPRPQSSLGLKGNSGSEGKKVHIMFKGEGKLQKYVLQFTFYPVINTLMVLEPCRALHCSALVHPDENTFENIEHVTKYKSNSETWEMVIYDFWLDFELSFDLGLSKLYHCFWNVLLLQKFFFG